MLNATLYVWSHDYMCEVIMGLGLMMSSWLLHDCLFQGALGRTTSLQ